MRVRATRRLDEPTLERLFDGPPLATLRERLALPIPAGRVVEVDRDCGRWLIAAQVAEEVGPDEPEEPPVSPLPEITGAGPVRVRLKRYLGRHSVKEIFDEPELAVIRRAISFPASCGKRYRVDPEIARLLLAAGVAEVVVEHEETDHGA